MLRKLFILLIIFNSISIIIAEINSRESAIEYYKQRSEIIKSNILETKYFKENIDLDYKSEKKYTVISLAGKETLHEDIQYLKYFPEVEAIHLSSAIQFKDKDLIYISNLPKLKILNLNKTNITGEGFKYLKDLPSLKEIDLTNTKVTDSNLQELKKFKTLENIWLYKSRVTKRGVEQLSKELPDCFISLEPQD